MSKTTLKVCYSNGIVIKTTDFSEAQSFLPDWAIRSDVFSDCWSLQCLKEESCSGSDTFGSYQYDLAKGVFSYPLNSTSYPHWPRKSFERLVGVNIPSQFSSRAPQFKRKFIDITTGCKRLIIKGCLDALKNSEVLEHPYIKECLDLAKLTLVASYKKKYPETPAWIQLKDHVEISDFSIIRAYPGAGYQDIHVDYPIGCDFAVEVTMFIGVSNLSVESGCTEIFTGKNSELQGKTTKERLNIFERNHYIPTSDRCKIFLINSQTYHRGGQNRTLNNRDLISLTLSLGAPCLNGLPCLVLSHHMNYSIEQRLVSGVKTYRDLVFSASFQQFLDEKKASMGVKLHLKLHCLLGKIDACSLWPILGYSCQFCGMITLKWSNYQRHAKSCKLSTLQHCRICNYTSSRAFNLRRHILESHHSIKGDVVKKCVHCTYQTTRKSNLNRHISTVHCVKNVNK